MSAFQMPRRNDSRVVAHGTSGRPVRIAGRRTVTLLEAPEDRMLLDFNPIAQPETTRTTSNSNLKEFAMSVTERLSRLNDQFRSRNRSGRRHQHAPVKAQVSPLEERCLLSAGDGPTSGLLMPAANVSKADLVMSQVNSTLKSITLTNNTNHKLYPFLEDTNVGKNPNIPAGENPYYDYTTGTPGGDVANSEYRLYAGYTTKVKGVDVSFLGVLPHSTITMTVPLVFWDGGTVRLVGNTASTRARFLQPFNPGGNALGRPFLFNAANASFFQQSAQVKIQRNNPLGIAQGAVQGTVLLYHTTDVQSKGLIPDAPAQLVEVTFRDPSVPNGKAPKFTSNVDYDISYINAMYLPVALEATKQVNGKQSVGYVGTLNTTAQIEKATKAFASGSILNGYFGGKGWPRYFLSNPPDPIVDGTLISIPGGANIYANTSAASSYNLSSTMLSSAAGNPPGLPPTANNYAATTMVNLWFGWLQYYLNTTHTPLTGNLAKLMSQPGVQPVAIKADPTVTWKLLSGQTVSDTQFAAAFAKTVYTVMNDFSNDPNLNFNTSLPAPITQFMGFILGNNVADVFSDTSPEGILLTQQLIALMRGEPNTSEMVQGQPVPSFALNPKDWYPAPAGPSSGKPFSVGKYNLNPFVWFVHDYIGKVYAYAFSVDDQYGNVQVDNSSQLQIAIGGPNGIGKLEPFVNGE